MIVINGYARTDKGRIRPINEDNFCIDRYFKEKDADAGARAFGGKEVLAGVFDGIGGEQNGETASFIAAKTMAGFDGRVPEGNWNLLINQMNYMINEYAKHNGSRNMGSTAAMVSVRKGTAEICNLGDSPIYLYSGGRLNKISKDHTELQRAIDMKLPDMNFESSGIRKNRLTRYLGIRSPELNPHIVVDIELHENDVLLICSDGLTDMVPEEEIGQMICGKDCRAIVDGLLEKALDNGGRDNTTVIAICCEEKKSWRDKLFG